MAEALFTKQRTVSAASWHENFWLTIRNTLIVKIKNGKTYFEIYSSNRNHAPFKTKICNWLKKHHKVFWQWGSVKNCIESWSEHFFEFLLHKNDCYTDLFLYMITRFVKLLMTTMDNRREYKNIHTMHTTMPSNTAKNNACKLHWSKYMYM